MTAESIVAAQTNCTSHAVETETETGDIGLTTDTTRACYRLTGLSDEELRVGTRSLVGRTNQVLAALLAHLAEVEARGLHRVRACASLYTYCLYELRMSEDEAFRRARAARIAREFPVVFEHVAAGEIHLTGILMLGPHLTQANHREVLKLAKFRSKREIAALVRRWNPLPSVPALVEPLGPESEPERRGVPTPTHATWSAFMQALVGPVRELREGQRPGDWTDDCADPCTVADAGRSESTEHSPASEAGEHGADASADADASANASASAATGSDAGTGNNSDAAANGAGAASWLSAPQRYKVQFTASQEYVDLLRQAQDLLAHTVPRRALDEVHLRAMRALVAELRRQKCGARRTARGRSEAPHAAREEQCRAGAGRGAEPRKSERAGHTRPEGRYVSRAVRRNIRLLCRSHNMLEAEEDFGRELVQAKVLGYSNGVNPRLPHALGLGG